MQFSATPWESKSWCRPGTQVKPALCLKFTRGENLNDSRPITRLKASLDSVIDLDSHGYVVKACPTNILGTRMVLGILSSLHNVLAQNKGIVKVH